MKIQTTNRLLELRNTLNSISQISWSFAMLNKQYSMQGLTEQEAQEMIKSYEALLNKVINIIKTEYENQNNTD
jgi:hypothetical protein